MRVRIASLPVVDPGSDLALIPPTSGTILLGAPIGADDYVEQNCLQLVEKIRNEMDLLKKIDQLPQQYYLILQRCYNTRALHLGRWVPPALLALAAKRHDRNVDYMWSRLVTGVNVGLDVDSPLPPAIRQARLPSKYGGCGLASLYDIRHPAFLSSVARAWNSFGPLQARSREYFMPTLTTSVATLVDCLETVTNAAACFPTAQTQASAATRRECFERAFGLPVTEADPAAALSAPLFSNFAADLGQTTSAQSRLTAIKNSFSYDQLLSDFYTPTMSTDDLARAARFLSGSCKEAVAWTSCIPSDPMFVIPPEEDRWLLSHHFLLPVPDRAFIGNHCTNTAAHHALDALGQHLFTCSSHRTVPHDNMRDRLHKFLSEAGLKPTAEPQDLLSNQTTRAPCRRRPDIAVGGVDPQGRVLLLDVTTTDAGCSHCVETRDAASRRGGPALGAEASKQYQYHNMFDASTQSFMPLAFELAGRWGVLTSKFFDMVKRIGMTRRGLTGQRYIYWASFWRRCISVGLQRDIVKSALRIRDQLVKHTPPAHPSNDIGHA